MGNSHYVYGSVSVKKFVPILAVILLLSAVISYRSVKASEGDNTVAASSRKARRHPRCFSQPLNSIGDLQYIDKVNQVKEDCCYACGSEYRRTHEVECKCFCNDVYKAFQFGKDVCSSNPDSATSQNHTHRDLNGRAVKPVHVTTLFVFLVLFFTN